MDVKRLNEALGGQTAEAVKKLNDGLGAQMAETAKKLNEAIGPDKATLRALGAMSETAMASSYEPPTLDPEIFRAEAERRNAPVITRDATLAMLDELRSTDRWARRTFWVATAALLVSIIAVALSLLLR